MDFLKEPIAIVGTGCRFPGQSNTSAKLWELLKNPQELSVPIPLSRFNSDGFYHPDGFHHGTSNVQKSYFLSEDVRKFDSQFFNISTAEAESMDPQQRQLLEVVFEAMESANMTLEEMRGTATAVYVGLMCDDYSGLIFADMETLPTYGATGAARSILSNRISYFFDWTGPSMTIDSACSSSLIAVHQAVQTLRGGECRVALAAGANLILSARMFVAESKLKMLSPKGRSRMWDAGGDGYARGEGIAAVMLKRLSDAIADGDHIECVIRETSANQGGRSTGLTVPNPVAQVNLIRQTYAKAGLDLDRVEDRPQYFQAHGTGTKVGDLNEATAIHNTFFGKTEDQNKEKIFVGSIKTIIGHSEGAAGIAGMLEAALAVKHGIIPPNLHFESLNPKLEPFIHQLEVPTKALQWPVSSDNVRRASVNSFGFGGTNAHVILENAPEQCLPPTSTTSLVALPFVFSASSERSLGSLLFNYSQYLSGNPDADLNALASTLLTRRSVFTHKVAFTSQTASELRSKLDDELEHRANGTSKSISSRQLSRPIRILGVFTGQGAQWPAMGWDLISTSSVGKATLERLEQSLAGLSVEHRPTWSLSAELRASAATSRVSEAVISQPLCTALQIILVDHLRALGVSFSGVVGHSSGEIGAAYAAGFISTDAAIKIAYFRGFYAKLAGNDGKLGSMIAVGISRSEAAEFCELPKFKGRIVVAASNSSMSVTLSGDADAVEEAKEHFERKQIFARVLKVDTAYHSHHMNPCSDPYLQALKSCDIQLLPRADNAAIWYSSVNEGEILDAQDVLLGPYWMSNMLNAVLFSQAINASTKSGSYDFAIEVGPHPALKGPVLDSLQEVSPSKKPISYVGLLARGKTGLETFSDALSSFWMHFGSTSFDAAAYAGMFNIALSRPLQGLPTYPWDHERTLWFESRGSRETRSRADPPHELLGIVTSDQAEGEYKWRNYLKLNEIPWLGGHQIQGQTIFPAAGYLVMALEGLKKLSYGKEIRLIEIQDFKILQAISINDDDSGVETLFTITNIVSNSKADLLTADFICHACLSKDTGSLVLVSSGRLNLHLGTPSTSALPIRSLAVINDLREVDVDGFYDALGDVGYGYTGPFRGISFLEQKLETATGLIIDANSTVSNSSMMMHPGTLDSAIQTLFACLGTPGDGSLWTLHVPVTIRNIRINPAVCVSVNPNLPRTEILFDAALAESDSDTLCGDVTLYDVDTRHALCQIEGIEVKPLMPATAADDRLLFHELVWGVAEPDASLVYRKTGFSLAETQKAETLERICLYYMKQLLDIATDTEKEDTSWHGKRILAFATHVVETTRAGRHASCKPEWLEDTWSKVHTLAEQYASDVDCKLLHVVGMKLIPFIRGETTILEHMREDGLLDLYYQNSELLEYNHYAGLITAQIAFRYPLIKILEIGGGTGGITRSILKHIDNKYSSYTFTDISVGFFEEAQETFKGHGRIIYEALDIERDPTTQGFTEHSYDLVIASNVLHATKVLDDTMTNVRKLLKPGGKLLVLEAVDNGAARVGFSFCGVPGWWAGADDGRDLTPLITPGQWDELLLRNGFSGLDTVTPGTDSVYAPVAVFVSSAVDEELQLLRQPLAYTGPKPQVETIFVVGGNTNATNQLVADLQDILRQWYKEIKLARSLEDLGDLSSLSMVHVLNLTELDTPIFSDLSSPLLECLKTLLNISASFLWVTAGSKSENPYSNMALGIGRTLVHEMPHLRVQVLDAAKVEELTADIVAKAFLRIVCVEKWENDIYAPQRMWSNEPELWLVDGRVHVTRVVPEKMANERLMSGRRVIEMDVGVDEVVEVVRNSDSYELRPAGAEVDRATTGDMVSICVTHSTLMALNINSSGFLHLVVGTMAGIEHKVIALSDSLGSTINTAASWTMPWDVKQGDEASLLATIAVEILAQTLIDTTRNDSSLLIFEPEASLAAAVSRKARHTSITPCLITTSDISDGQNWIGVHEFDSDRNIKAKLPTSVSTYVDMSDHGTLRSRIGALLPFHCQRLSLASLFSHTAHYDRSAPYNSVVNSLSIALANSLSVMRSSRPAITPVVISAAELLRLTTPTLGLQIIDWNTLSTLPMRVQSAESLMKFRSDRTYLLIGMAGNLGRSLCRWMILHGAKHIVLTSRNPSIAQSWLDEMSKLGGAVKVMAMDVSSEASLLSTHAQITSTLPPIAGVANAAMVLSDTLLSNMTLSEMATVLKPKVDGSRFLSSLFPSNTLDFFILFGSSVDIMGNSGQSAYIAANMFMNALVCSRHARGLAGSLIGLGEVKGVGYAARMKRELNDIIGATLPLSEKEVHVMFAEGVLAGRPGSGRNPVLYAGMDSKDPRKDPDILWYPHPKFWHYIESGDGVAKAETKGATVSLKSQLDLATSKDEVLNMVTEAFTTKLRHKLQISSETPVPSEAVLMELGIDSLVSVDLRAWFVMEMGVDMPILKILGGASIADLVGDAVGRLPGGMVPMVAVEEVEGVLVPNGLGGHDLVAATASPLSSNVEVKSTEAVLTPGRLTDVVVVDPASVPLQIDIESMTVEVQDPSPHQGHSKNLSLASTSSAQTSISHDTSSSHASLPSAASSLPDLEVADQAPKSLDLNTNIVTILQDQGSSTEHDETTTSPSSIEEQLRTPESGVFIIKETEGRKMSESEMTDGSGVLVLVVDEAEKVVDEGPV